MRILIALHGFPPTHSAGAERQAERMARWLLRHHDDVEVFAVEQVADPHYRVETSVEDGLTIHRLYYDLGQGEDSFANSYDHPDIARALTDVLNSKPFDLVHVISGYLLGASAVQAIRSLGIPVIVSPMEYWFLCAQLNLIQPTGALCSGPESDRKCARCLMEMKRRYRIPAKAAPVLADGFWKIGINLPEARETADALRQRRLKLQEALGAADRVICNSNFLISKFEEFGFNTDSFVYLRQGLTVPPQLPEKSPRTGPLRIGYIGQVKYHKGVDLLIDATIRLLGENRQVSLDLWGDDKAEPTYTADLQQRSQPFPAIQWRGKYTGSKVWEILAGFDVLVVPSRWYENSPNVILEAHHAGLPVIATNLGGMAELIEHERDGLLFGLNDSVDLYTQLNRLITEPDLPNRLHEGIRPVRTIDQEMQDTLEYYQQVIKDKVM